MTSPQNESAGSSQLGRSASDLGQQTKETAGRIADQQISKQKQTASGVLEQVAGALQMTGEHLRSSEQERVARFAQQAADRVRQLSESIRDAEPRELIRRAEEVARREPALFLGGAFVLGLLGARFLKSSERAAGRGREMPRLERAGQDPYGVGPVETRSSSTALDEDPALGALENEAGAVREH